MNDAEMEAGEPFMKKIIRHELLFVVVDAATAGRWASSQSASVYCHSTRWGVAGVAGVVSSSGTFNNS